MNPKNSIWQIVKDGLVGVAVTLILFGIFIRTIFKMISSDVEVDWELVTVMFFSPDSFFTPPMPFVLLIGFISMGIGGQFFENITSRWSLLKPILIIAVVSWIIGVVLFQIAFIEYWVYGLDGDIVGITAAGAGAGFLIAGLAGIIFNPTKRLFRLIIGAIASTTVAYVVGFWIFLYQIMQ